MGEDITSTNSVPEPGLSSPRGMPVRAAGKRTGRIRLPSLQEADPETRLREPVGHHRPTEPGPNYDRVEVRLVHLSALRLL